MIYAAIFLVMLAAAVKGLGLVIDYLADNEPTDSSL